MAFVTRRRSHFLAFLIPLGGVADLLRYDGLLCSGRPADLLRNTGRFTPEHAFDGKCLALDMLGITVYLDGENVEVTGAIELENKALRCSNHLNLAPLLS